MLPDLQITGLDGSFVKLDATSDDLSIAVNGVHIVRVHNDQISSLPLVIGHPEVVGRLIHAKASYSDDKVAKLLKYSSDVDCRLSEFFATEKPHRGFNPYYTYYRIMGMSANEFRLQTMDLPADVTPEAILAKKREIINKICMENGVRENEFPNGYGFKRLRREIEAVSMPIIQRLKEKVHGNTLEIMIDNIAQRYTPESAGSVQEAALRIASIFGEMYFKAKHYGVLMPKDQQLLTFFSQVTERIFGEETRPLNMFVVACPRYGENDEYDRLEEGLSKTSSTYLHALPLLTTVLAKNGIPYKSFVLINDTEEQMIDGSLLNRLDLTKETYREKCRGNVEAVNQAIAEDERITGASAHLFTEIFPDFMNVTESFEKQLYRLTKNDAELRLAMAKVADGRFDRHRKIMGGKCDFSDSFYLAIHYSAEYMALGYLCRTYSELSNNSFIVNYNSPNVEQFNSQGLLARSIKGDMSVNKINTIPVFQVKYY